MNQKEKIKKLVSSNMVGMFVTQNEGKIFSRPIAYADIDDDNNVWFFTDINSEKINDIIDSNQVNFSFANHSANEYVSISGTAQMINDQEIVDEKWSFYMRAWWPDGKNSESLTLIKVTPESTQYWDGSSSKIIQAYDISKALLTGKSYVEVNDSVNEMVKYDKT